MSVPLRLCGAVAVVAMAVFPSGLVQASAASHASPPSFTLQNVGVLKGGTDAYGYGINDAGEVSGRSAVVTGTGKKATITTHAFLYENGKLIDLGAPSGSQASLGFGINSAGDVAAVGIREGHEAPFAISTSSARKWNSLPVSGASADYALDYSINNRFSACGSIEGRGAIVWTKTANGYTSKWLSGGHNQVATAIDQNGDVSGYTGKGSGASGAASLWLANGSRLSLAAPATKSGEALAVTAARPGYVLVAGQVITKTGAQEAILWHVEKAGSKWTEGANPLPLLKEYVAASATAVNTNGWVVGYVTHGAKSAAAIWVNGLAYNLNSLLQKAKGWNLLRAEAINNRGQITGWAAYKGEIRPFLLTPAQ